MDHASLVLAADDNVDDIFLLQLAWKKAAVAARLEVVSDGDEVMSYLDGTGQYADRLQYPRPRLLLLDLNMQRKDGFQTLDWVRKHPDCERLPVVILTASVRPTDINRAYACGANAFLVKPLAVESFVQMVKALADFWLLYNRAPVLPPPV